ncbi:MAG: NADH-quinone oxidoreductase subunit J [Verrucomicrobiota bacterium]
MNATSLVNLLVALVFGAAILATVAGALIAVLTTRIIRSVCGLAICCFGLAGLYYFLRCPFLSLMEILIYVGAICVTIIFAVMLAEPDESASGGRPAATLWWGSCALLTSLGAFAGLAYLGLKHSWFPAATQANQGTVKDMGIALLSTYSLPFELISLVLLVAVLGALVVAREGRSRTES